MQRFHVGSRLSETAIFNKTIYDYRAGNKPKKPGESRAPFFSFMNFRKIRRANERN